MNRAERRRKFGMSLLFTVIIFLSLLIDMVVVGFAVVVLVKTGIINIHHGTENPAVTLVSFFALISIPMGILTSFLAGKIPLRPVMDIIEGMNRLAAGDFGTRITAGKIMRRYPAFVEVADSFNKMAQELENMEAFRADIINSFSHEIKTPIVSVAGFAKLLRKGNLDRSQQDEYLKIIEEESLRLADMATRVLNVTKLENQNILTNVTKYNLSEQLRFCMLLLEDKWMKKELEPDFDFGEYYIYANEELLRQVWLNIMDNAVKFAPRGHTIRVTVAEKDGNIQVSIMNTGSHISDEDIAKIFNKYYQTEESRQKGGNGTGLAIVRNIVQLHSGSVEAKSENDVTVFTVKLPGGGVIG